MSKGSERRRHYRVLDFQDLVRLQFYHIFFLIFEMSLFYHFF